VARYHRAVRTRPLLVAGPCGLESEELALEVASGVASAAEALGYDWVFKASFDKANRTAGTTWRGPGLSEGLRILAAVRDATGARLLTDIHEPTQAAAVAEVVDVLQIPAFLCRQTDLLLAAGATGRTVNLKKGQFLAPWQTGPAVQKLRDGGASEVWLTERGTSFGHGDLVVDFRGLPAMQATGCPVIFDATHSAQRPGAHGERSGGDRSVVPVLTRAAAGAGFDGLFVEVHPDPAQARSDADTQWPLAQLPDLLESFHRLWTAGR
jgi:2-dehydro-3-deoxyphosphooctonate aldolase (KDO 8-P synthase)